MTDVTVRGASRRGLFTGVMGGALAGALSTAGAATAQGPAAPASPSPLAAKLSEAALAARKPLRFAHGRFSGEGWDFLVREGAAAQFTLLGEQHGLAEIPALTTALFEALQPSGYERLVVETSPQGARALDAAARDGLDGIRRLYQQRPPGVAFFSQKSEAELAAFVRARVPGRAPALVGLDYEVGSFPLLIEGLRGAPARARPAVAALTDAAETAWRKTVETGNPQFFPAFSLDPELVRAVRRAWPAAAGEALWTLDTLEETLEINRLWVAGDNYGSNARRNAFNRANLHRWWRAETKAGRAPKALFKFGGGHVSRGLNGFGGFDLGNTAFELAAAEGKGSFHLLIGGALDGQSRAQFDPVKRAYAARTEKNWWGDVRGVLEPAAFTDAWTVLDLRPLRAVVHRAPDAAGLPLSTIRQMDAVVLIPNATPQQNL